MPSPLSRFSSICATDTQKNYEFFFSFLLSRLSAVLQIENLPDGVDESAVKNWLFLDGMVSVFNESTVTSQGIELIAEDVPDLIFSDATGKGKLDYTYKHKEFNVTNSNLANGTIEIVTQGEDKNGVIIWNSATDPWSFGAGRGIGQLLRICASLLADNIVSISCAQLNSRVEAIYSAATEAEATSAEAKMKELYSGKPYQVFRGDAGMRRLQVNPLAEHTDKIRQLLELTQYIMSFFWQSVGVKFSGQLKKERVITDEVSSVDDYLGVSLYGMRDEWEKGFEKVNEMFGTDIHVKINPILAYLVECDCGETVAEQSEDETAAEQSEDETAAEQSEDETAAEQSEDETAAEQSEDETAADPAEEETAAEQTEDKDAADPAEDEPVADQTEEETAADPADDEPVEDQTEDEDAADPAEELQAAIEEAIEENAAEIAAEIMQEMGNDNVGMD